ncbi:MAG: TM2 domain-containing protein [Flavobacteriales bacterium]|jgi:TM2 domain-containing membrane protein YozV
MNIYFKFSAFLVVVAMMFGSCTMEKRRYASGYHMEWNHRKHTPGDLQAKSDKKQYEPSVDAVATETSVSGVQSIEITPAVIESTAAVVVADQVMASPASKVTSSTQQPVVAHVESQSTVSQTLPRIDQKINMSAFGKKASASAVAGGGKSWVTTLLLCFFLGGLGIHRFYLGYTWQGVVQLLTLGGLGIWVLIDFIRIITRSLKPKSGDYED